MKSKEQFDFSNHQETNEQNDEMEDFKLDQLSSEEKEELFMYDRDALNNYTIASLMTLNVALKNDEDFANLSLPSFGKLRKISPKELNKSKVMKKVYGVFSEFSDKIKNIGEEIEEKLSNGKKYKKYKIKGDSIEKLRDEIQIIWEAFYRKEENEK